MKRLKPWQKWGLTTAISYLLLSLASGLADPVWWYQETIWYQALQATNYPAAAIHRIIFRVLGMPQVYDVPLSGRETLLFETVGVLLGMIWWFLIGAGLSMVRRLSRKADAGVHPSGNR